MKEKLREEINNLALEFVINDEAKNRLIKIVDDLDSQPELNEKIIQILKSNLRPRNDTRIELLEQAAKEIGDMLKEGRL